MTRVKPSSTPHPGYGSERFRQRLYAVLRLAIREGLVERDVRELVRMLMHHAGWVERQKRARERRKKLSTAERKRESEQWDKVMAEIAAIGAGPHAPILLRGPIRVEQTPAEQQAEREIVARAAAGLCEDERLRKLLGIGLDDGTCIAQVKTRCVCGDVFAAHEAKEPHACRVVTRAHARLVGDHARSLVGERCKCKRFRRETRAQRRQRDFAAGMRGAFAEDKRPRRRRRGH